MEFGEEYGDKIPGFPSIAPGFSWLTMSNLAQPGPPQFVQKSDQGWIKKVVMPVWVNFGLLTNLNIGLEVLGLGKFPRHFNISYVKANDERICLAGNDASLHPFFWQKPVATIWSVWGMGHWDVSNLEHHLESFGL